MFPVYGIITTLAFYGALSGPQRPKVLSQIPGRGPRWSNEELFPSSGFCAEEGTRSPWGEKGHQGSELAWEQEILLGFTIL